MTVLLIMGGLTAMVGFVCYAAYAITRMVIASDAAERAERIRS